MELNLSAANEVIRREGVAIPDNNIQFSKAFDECADELFLERWVLTSICTRFGLVPEISIFKTDIGILP